MDIAMLQAPGRKAAMASSRAKRGFVIACVLFGAAYFASGWQGREAPAVPSQPVADVQDVLTRLAVTDGSAATVTVRNMYYEKHDGVTCGEVNGRTSRGADMKFRDGVRIFVCGPTLPDKPRH